MESERLQKESKGSEGVTSKDITDVENNMKHKEREIGNRNQDMVELQYLREKVTMVHGVILESLNNKEENVNMLQNK